MQFPFDIGFATSSACALRATLAALLCTATCGCGTKLRPDVLEHVRLGTERVDSPETIDVPMVGGASLPMVKVRLNGHGPYRFLIDLGGNVVSVRKAVAVSAGLEVVQELGHHGVVSADMAVGHTTFRNVYLVREPVLDVDGVIGFNLFRQGVVTLDYPAQRFRWRSGDLTEGEGGAVVPYRLQGRMPYVQAQIGIKSVWANLDTGAKPALIVPAKLESSLPKLGNVRESALWNQAEGRIKTGQAQLSGALSIGANLLLANPTVTFSPALENEFLIGSGSLLAFRLTLDTGSKLLLVERPRPWRAPSAVPVEQKPANGLCQTKCTEAGNGSG